MCYPQKNTLKNACMLIINHIPNILRFSRPIFPTLTQVNSRFLCPMYAPVI